MSHMDEAAPPSGEEPLLKGHLLISRIHYLRETHGAPGIARVMAALPEADRALLEDVRPEDWYPFVALGRLDRTIRSQLAPNDPRLYERLGEASARERTAWLGEQAGLVTVHSFLSRLADRHRRIHSFGRAEYRRTGFREGELRVSGYPIAEPSYCASALGFLRSAVEILTGAAASVDEVGCQCRSDEACAFRLSWRGASGAAGG